MFADAAEVDEGATLRGDLCIVGAGAAGIALARSLSGRGLRIIVLEGGGLEHEPSSQALYKGRNVGQPYFPLETARLRQFGGTTAHWGGTCRPEDPLDLERRDGIPDTGWPISLRDIEPFYGEAAKIVGLAPGNFSLEERLDDDRFEPLELGGNIRTRLARFVPQSRRRYGTRYRAELRDSRDIQVLLHANVIELESDADARRVERVHVRTLAGRRFTVAAREFVLASGALENARLLLSSDRHRPRGLGNDHDVVGRYFLEHPRFRAATLQPAKAVFETRFYEQHLVGREDVEGYLALDDATQRANQMLDVQLKLRAVLDGAYAKIDDAPDVVSLRALIGQRLVRDDVSPRPSVDVANVVGDLMTWHHYAVPGAPLPVPHPDVLAEVARASPVDRRALLPGLLGEMAGYAYEKLLGSAPVKSVDVTARMTPVPNRDSRMTLSRERDALGMRRIDLDWQLSRFDRENLLRTLDRFGAAVGATGKGRVRVLVAADGPWPTDLAGGWHQMGTTRMSNDPRKGVVDRDCRVHGIANLYVAGSSVFPTAGSGTPTLTLTALALRLGRHLGGVLR